MKLCTFKGCGKKVKARGLCDGHYSQRQRGKELVPLRLYGNGGTVRTARQALLHEIVKAGRRKGVPTADLMAELQEAVKRL